MSMKRRIREFYLNLVGSSALVAAVAASVFSVQSRVSHQASRLSKSWGSSAIAFKKDDKPVLYDDGKENEEFVEVSVNKKRHAVVVINKFDYAIECLLLVLALITRFYRLDAPKASVFDETHFGRFISQYDMQEYFFDIHPPLAKLTMYGIAKLFGFHYMDPSRFKFKNIGVPFPDDLIWYPLRAVPATFGALCTPLMYRTCKKLGIDSSLCIMAAIFVNFDMCLVIESRLILTDSQLIFYCGLALYLMLELWDTEPNTKARTKYIVLTGLACGAAISVKFTALATPGLTGLTCMFGLYFPMRGRIPFLQCMAIMFLGLALFFVSFKIHFMLTPRTGDGAGFMPAWFRRSLIGDKMEILGSPKPWFARSVIYLIAEMIRANARISAKHNWQSSWYTWPIDKRGILYFVERDKLIKDPNYNARIYLLGNPLMYWIVAFLIGVFILSQLVLGIAILIPRGRLRIRASKDRIRVFCCVGWFCMFGWLLNLLPYLDITRATFIYHYLPGLWYGVILAAWTSHSLVRVWKARLVISVICCVAVFAAYVYFAPWVYSIPILNSANDKMRWLKTWN